MALFFGTTLILPPDSHTLTVNVDGTIIDVTTATDPYWSHEDIAIFATNAIKQARSVQFNTFAEDMQQTRPYFTDAGWSRLIDAVSDRDDGYLQTLVDHRLISSAVSYRPAVVVSEGVHWENKQYQWIVEVPMMVVYQSAQERAVQYILARITVHKIDPGENPRGLAIDNIEERSYSGGDFKAVL
jgi:hypothetical protein